MRISLSISQGCNECILVYTLNNTCVHMKFKLLDYVFIIDRIDKMQL